MSTHILRLVVDLFR